MSTTTMTVSVSTISGTSKAGNAYSLVKISDSTRQSDWFSCDISSKAAPGVLAFLTKWAASALTILDGFCEGTEYASDGTTFEYDGFISEKGKNKGKLIPLIRVGSLKMGKLAAGKLAAAIRQDAQGLTQALQGLTVTPSVAPTPTVAVSKAPSKPAKGRKATQAVSKGNNTPKGTIAPGSPAAVKAGIESKAVTQVSAVAAESDYDRLIREIAAYNYQTGVAAIKRGLLIGDESNQAKLSEYNSLLADMGVRLADITALRAKLGV
jgi:hypothetical protein